MPAPSQENHFGAEQTLKTTGASVTIYRLDELAKALNVDLSRMPFSVKVLLESALRNLDGFQVTADDVTRIANWKPKGAEPVELPFKPGRVVLQDFTGVPSVVDLAAMRAAMKRLGGDPKKINPQVPCDLVIDHSVQVDAFASVNALSINSQKEFERNRERYEFLKWGQQAFDNFRVVPPATGIVHQVNLEYLASVVMTSKVGGKTVAYPDSLVGTDSHTTMINGLGVVGWGVGGIEAEAVMLGQPLYMLTPEVIGFKLIGRLPEGATATDMVLTVTEMLRKKGVVGKFVEFYGDGLTEMSLPDRATIANMAPEYGATIGLFPIDKETLRYMKLTGRSADQIDLVERYCKEQGVWHSADAPEPTFTDTLSLDLSTVQPSLAGPKRPQDRILLSNMKPQWRQDLSVTFGKSNSAKDSTTERMVGEGGESAAATAVLEETHQTSSVSVEYDGHTFELKDGAVVIAAITSCTNTSNPSVMLGAGLLARNAAAKGLTRKPWVKTSLAPGSRVVTDYLQKAGLDDDLEKLGFHTVGYGCTTCIAHSGPLPDPIADGIQKGDLVAASVLSGNRNFEGRINPHVKANYLASPPLVVAYALAGTVDIDLTTDPLGQDDKGNDVFLKDIWPSQKEIRDTVANCVSPDQFEARYGKVFEGEKEWQDVAVSGGDLYEWKQDSTYVQNPPFFETLTAEATDVQPIKDAHCLVMVGDSVTTDHISPAGAIKKDSPAGKYLQENGVEPKDFNSYGSRRGNDRVMTRGTFANIRLRNLLAPGTEGGVTTYIPSNEQMSIYDAAMKYAESKTPLVVLAGKEYGTGSSRDWAAKGTFLLGVRAVIAESYERIHRSNLVGMGVLPLQHKPGDTRESLGLTGKEKFTIQIDELKPQQTIKVTATPDNGNPITFEVVSRLDSPVEIDYYQNGGILQTVIRNMLKG